MTIVKIIFLFAITQNLLWGPILIPYEKKVYGSVNINVSLEKTPIKFFSNWVSYDESKILGDNIKKFNEYTYIMTINIPNFNAYKVENINFEEINLNFTKLYVMDKHNIKIYPSVEELNKIFSNLSHYVFLPSGHINDKLDDGFIMYRRLVCSSRKIKYDIDSYNESLNNKRFLDQETKKMIKNEIETLDTPVNRLKNFFR